MIIDEVKKDGKIIWQVKKTLNGISIHGLSRPPGDFTSQYTKYYKTGNHPSLPKDWNEIINIYGNTARTKFQYDLILCAPEYVEHNRPWDEDDILS